MPRRPLNLLMIAVDSLRRDHLSCYGYPRLTSPHLDRLAAGGVLFENSFSAYIPTTPGYSTMLTGRDVMATGMVSLSPKGPLDTSQPTLPEILKEHGYTSGCVGFGGDFYRGFDKYADYAAWVSWEDRPARKAENLNEKAIPLLEEMVGSGQPFLLFLRHMDPHSPYLPPPPFDRMFYSGNPCDPSQRTMEPVFAFKPFADFFRSWMPPGITDVEYVIAQYDGELAYMDACIARLFTRLEELGVADNTLVLLTSDHGETLYDHDCFFDHHGLYEPTLMVPMVFHAPGLLPAGLRTRSYALLEDVVPTILDLLGLRQPLRDIKFDGRSLLPLIRGERANYRSEFYITECTWERKRGWRTPQWKLIDALEPDFHNKPPVELYNLLEDPRESKNLARREPGVVQCLKDRMTRWVEKRVKETGKEDPILGYQIGLDKRIGSVATAKKLQDR
jgi:arylsulfatase A-like enzyme